MSRRDLRLHPALGTAQGSHSGLGCWVLLRAPSRAQSTTEGTAFPGPHSSSGQCWPLGPCCALMGRTLPAHLVLGGARPRNTCPLLVRPCWGEAGGCASNGRCLAGPFSEARFLPL